MGIVRVTQIVGGVGHTEHRCTTKQVGVATDAVLCVGTCDCVCVCVILGGEIKYTEYRRPTLLVVIATIAVGGVGAGDGLSVVRVIQII